MRINDAIASLLVTRAFSAMCAVNAVGSRAAVACAAAVVLVTPSFADDVVVELKSACSLPVGNVVTVGDIANVRTESARLKQRVEALDVADALTESSVQRVSRRELEMRLLIAGIAANELVLVGADQAVVQAQVRGSFLADLEKRVTAELVKQFGLDADAVSVQINNQAALQVLEGQLVRTPYRIRLVFGDRLPVGRSQIECRFETAQGSTSQRLDAYVTVSRNVAITTMPILSGTKIDPSMIQVVKRPMVSSVAYVDPSSIVGKTASRNIESNQLLQASYFRSRRSTETLVRRYDLIDVFIQFGGGQVRLKDAKVMSAGGNAGDTIEVLNTKTNKRLSAIVVDRNTAKRTPLTGSGN